MSNPAAVERPRVGRMPSPPVVALAGWALPGAGYWLIGERARALTVGLTIAGLFILGLLIGGVRAIQVPAYGEEGGRLYVVAEESGTRDGKKVYVVTVREHQAGGRAPSDVWVGSDFRALLADIGNKPWSICQIMTGPMAVAAGAWSVQASRPVDGGGPAGVLSHSRINEIAVLYTAVAGMLNLLVIIDAAARAGREADGDADESDARRATPSATASSAEAA